jgi:uncharacterized membrane protein
MKFQLERILLFSDAVFAIAITLMIIEIKPPHLEAGMNFKEALAVFSIMTPTFLGTILSFYLIGLYWFRHHDLMKYVVAYDSKMVWLNFTFLLCVAFIPFSTAFVFENIKASSALPLMVYNLNNIIVSLLSFRIFKYSLDPANKLCIKDTGDEMRKVKSEIIFGLGVYAFVIVLAIIVPGMAHMGYAAFGLQNLIVKKFTTKKTLKKIAEPEIEANSM